MFNFYNRSNNKKHNYKFIFIILVFTFLLPTKKSFAQCEDPANFPSTVITSTTTLVNAVPIAIKGMEPAINTALNTLSITTQGVTLSVKQGIIKQLEWFWLKWEEGLKTMFKQIAVGGIEKTRQLGTYEDGDNMNVIARKSQIEEYKARKSFQPTDEACQFDTAAGNLRRGNYVKKAISKSYTSSFSKIGSNSKNSVSAGGEAAAKKSRWESYKNNFCDLNSNAGYPGCTNINPMANTSVMTSKTIFAKETIDLSDLVAHDAIKQLIFNITGYESSDAVANSVQETAAGLEQRQKNREYMAQMDAIGSMVYSIIAERAPGKPSPEIQNLRIKRGITTASPNPSIREVRQSIVEQLWDPNYYKNLYESKDTIVQKELYLKAYSLVMLNDIIAKQEKISNAYAIETANMLSKIKDNADSTQTTPLK